MASSSSLPFDIVEDIISRAPIESLIRCKRTCKQWYALCKDKRFIYKHLDLSKERLMRFCPGKDVEIINPVTLDLLRLPVPDEFVSVVGKIYFIHCNGLLLCLWSTTRIPRHTNIAVWNPVLGQIKLVESTSHHYMSDIYGFGYDNNRDSYKILRIGCSKFGKFEIYDFKSKLWRAFSATFDWVLYLADQYVSMNGNMYWVAQTRDPRNRETFIQSFDFSKETFKPICLLPFERRRTGYGFDDKVAFSGSRGDRLSLFRQNVGDQTREMEVWVTNKVTDGVVSWSKYFNVTRPDLPLLNPWLFSYVNIPNPTFFIHKPDSIVLWCNEALGDGYATSFYEIGQGEIKKHVETRQPFTGEGGRNPSSVSNFVYVPSLVPVPE